MDKLKERSQDHKVSDGDNDGDKDGEVKVNVDLDDTTDEAARPLGLSRENRLTSIIDQLRYAGKLKGKFKIILMMKSY